MRGLRSEIGGGAAKLRGGQFSAQAGYVHDGCLVLGWDFGVRGTRMASDAPASVVQKFYAALDGGDLAAARNCWANDGVWHVTGRSDLAGDYDPEAYLEMLGEWAACYRD